VLEQGGRGFEWLNRRPSRGAVILLAVGLAAGLAGGYAAGHRQAPRNISPATASSGSASATPDGGGPALSQANGTCAVQSGRQLQLGVQVINGSTATIRLGQVHVVLPLGGLRAISQQWAPCGSIGVSQDPASLGPGDSAWFSVTFQVLVGCPGPLPVQFTVDYSAAGKLASADLPGFSDLGSVPYTGCPEQEA